MKMRKGIISLSIIAITTICMFNSVAAAPVSTSTTAAHGVHVTDVRGNWWDIPKKPNPPDPLMHITITDYP
ncbi:MAG: hypothetical protein WCE81_05705 [Halobacteriota archaeon]